MAMDARTIPSGLVDTRYKFLAKEFDVETDYDWLGARGYDARIGRFLNPDPLDDFYPKINSYCYSLDNAIRYLDETGLSPTGSDDPPDNAPNPLPGVTVIGYYDSNYGGQMMSYDWAMRIIDDVFFGGQNAKQYTKIGDKFYWYMDKNAIWGGNAPTPSFDRLKLGKIFEIVSKRNLRHIAQHLVLGYS